MGSSGTIALSPVLAMALTVALATGGRIRIPFDLFLIVVACALVVGDLDKVEGLPRA